MPPRHDASPGEPRIRQASSAELTAAEVSALRALLWAAFEGDGEGFSDLDWEHALGGMHFLLEIDGSIVAHAAVVERELQVGSVPLRTGYVEAVATLPAHQGQGAGSRLMASVTAHVRARSELGALGTGRHRFYERLGWRVWSGPTAVRVAGGLRRTPDDDGSVMVLLTPTSPHLDLTAELSCDWRPGDVW